MPASTSPVRETASWGRRFGALAIDWAASWLVALALVGADASGWLTLLIFWLQTSLGTTLAAGSFGQLCTRIRVLRTHGLTLDPGRAFLRQLLVCAVIPPLVFKPDGRGLHDLATDSAAYRLP